MASVTIKRGDTHVLKFSIEGTGITTLTGASGQIHVKPRRVNPTILSFPVSLAGNVATWTLDGSLPVGQYDIEIQLTVDGRITTAPSDGYLRLVVLADLA